jgi:hypothetical protein
MIGYFRTSSNLQRGEEVEKMKWRLNAIDNKVECLGERIESMSHDLELILDYVKEKK